MFLETGILQRKPFNYIYFLFFFVCVAAYTVARFFSMQALSNSEIPQFFLFYSLGQTCFEVGLIWIFCALLKDFFPRWVYYIGICTSFFLLLIHLTNFVMLRLLDSNLCFLLKFFSGHGVGHIFSVFQAINMNRGMMAFIIASVVSIPLCSIVFYKITNFISLKKPYSISLIQVFILVFATGIFLFSFERKYLQNLPFYTHTKYEKTLPLGFLCISPNMPQIHLPQGVSDPKTTSEIGKDFSSSSIEKPNIYLFVVETFRKDFIRPEIAPALAEFAQKNIQAPFSFANANSTHCSWFSIFHATFPYHWTQLKKTRKEGSFPLQILKKMGYKIRVYSSADLSYFEMDEMIFGPDRNLTDSVKEFALDRSLESWQRDAKAMECFEKDLKEEEGKQGNLFIFFFDATHSEYSFPKETISKFQPAAKQIDYLSLNLKDLEPIKNRYRNAVYYVDSLFQRFFDDLSEMGLYEKAIVAITGDHGEEFFEEGSLFHGTHLNDVQTNVPIFFKFPSSFLTLKTNTVTHIDIFPSILHWLTKKDNTHSFDGASIFSENRWPYRLAVLQNGAKTPCEFIIAKENFSLRARFTHPEDLYTENSLELLSLKTKDKTQDAILWEEIIRQHYSDALIPFIKNKF